MSIKPKVNLRENKNAKKKFKNLQSAKSTLRKLLFLEYLFMNIFCSPNWVFSNSENLKETATFSSFLFKF